MNTLFLILGLTIIYYVVLFNLDKRRKAAFQKAAQQAIGKTTTSIEVSPEIPTDVFGPVIQKDTSTGQPKETTDISKNIKEDNTEVLKTQLEKMVMEVEAEKNLDLIENKDLQALADNTELLNEKQLTDLVDDISKPISRKTQLKPKAL